MRFALLENNTVVNVIVSNAPFDGYVQCPPGTSIGWTSVDGVNFSPPSASVPEISDYKESAINRLTSFKDEELKNILGKTLAHETVMRLIRFMAAESYNNGTASAGQIGLIESESGHKGQDPAIMAGNAASKYSDAQITIGHLKGIADVAESDINAATTLQEIDDAIAAAINAWNAI